MKRYSFLLSKRAKKELAKLDKSVQVVIVSWIQKNIKGTSNPRLHVESLAGNKKVYWRYRIGNYRVVAEIKDEELVIIAITIANRREAYK